MILESKPWTNKDDLDVKAVERKLEAEAVADYQLAVEDAEKLQMELDERRANFGWRKLLIPEMRAGFRNLQKAADDAITLAFKLRVTPGAFADQAKATVVQRRQEQRRWLARPDVQEALRERGELEQVRAEMDDGNEQVIEAAASNQMVTARRMATGPRMQPDIPPQTDSRFERRM